MMVDRFLDRVAGWAGARDDIAAVLLVGSHARGDARPDSDVDIVILTETPARYVDDQDWTETFGDVRWRSVENWGAATSVRTSYASGLEVEFGFALPDWASVDPVDPGTRRVIEKGLRILMDRHGLVDQLKAHVEPKPWRRPNP